MRTAWPSGRGRRRPRARASRVQSAAGSPSARFRAHSRCSRRASATWSCARSAAPPLRAQSTQEGYRSTR